MRPTSRKWICDKVIEWLREDASVGPKELQRRIHHKYKVLVDYKRVFVGKELALTILCGSCEDSFDQLFSFKGAGPIWLLIVLSSQTSSRVSWQLHVLWWPQLNVFSCLWGDGLRDK